MAQARFFPSKFPGKCACGASYSEGDPILRDGEPPKVIRCRACAQPADQREIARVDAAEETRRRDAVENARRAAEAPADAADYARRAGNAGPALATIYAHPGIRADLARHHIHIDQLASALANLAAADVSRANCSHASWIAAAEQCAAWGLIPTMGADTPVYLFCRDTKTQKLSAERSRYGLAIQLSRALDDCEIVTGWVFRIEALLGDLARRIKAGDPTARAEADAMRERLAARAGEQDQDRIDLRHGLRVFFDDDAPFPTTCRPALARAGKVAEEPLRGALRAVYAGRPLDDDQRAAIVDLRMDLDAAGSSLRPDEAALLAALSLPGWESHIWYTASGETTDRFITFAPPSEALWSRPPMDYRTDAGAPVVWYATVRWTDDNGVRHDSGMELSRARFYERAVAGRTVRLTSEGLLASAKDAESHILIWHGEAGTAKALREWLKNHPTLLESARVRAAIGALDDETTIIDEQGVPVVGIQHLRHVRQLVDQGETTDYAAENERIRQREPVMVGAK